MRALIISMAAIFLHLQLAAQTKFYSSVKIEFERNTNPRKAMEDWNKGQDWFERFKENIPTSSIVYFEFIGDTTHSLYKPGRDVPLDPRSFWRPVADKNVIYNDYTTGIAVSQKPVYEETFLITDSFPKIKWKITNDLRTIAGFECRKAFGVLNDTIGVFAFYTDQILVNGGPESIQGLPGMILGVGIPRLHTTWFATKVELMGSGGKPVTPPVKGKKIEKAAFLSTLNKLAEQWGPQARMMLLNFVI